MVVFQFRETATPGAKTPSALLLQWQQLARRPPVFGGGCTCCGLRTSVALDEIGDGIFEYLQANSELNGDPEIAALLDCAQHTSAVRNRLTALLTVLSSDETKSAAPAAIEKLCRILQRSIESVSEHS